MRKIAALSLLRQVQTIFWAALAGLSAWTVFSTNSSTHGRWFLFIMLAVSAAFAIHYATYQFPIEVDSTRENRP